MNERHVEDVTQWLATNGNRSRHGAAFAMMAEERLDLIDALQERITAAWGDWSELPTKYMESFRRDYPTHPVVKAERLVAKCKGIDCPNDPAHQGQDEKWWFWTEDWATAEGPFETEELCRAALAKYCEQL